MKTQILTRFTACAAALVLALGFTTVAAAGHHEDAMAKQDIAGVAASNPDFSTLVTALQTAGLVEALQGEGPLTVFAPTNEAFAKLPDGALEALLQDKDKLTKILTYHVVPGQVTAADVMKLDSAKTLEGTSLTIDTSSGVQVNDAQVVKADVMASNGVIHVIDTVLLPSE